MYNITFYNIVSLYTILYITISYDTIIRNTALYILHAYKHNTDDNEKISP